MSTDETGSAASRPLRPSSVATLIAAGAAMLALALPATVAAEETGVPQAEASTQAAEPLPAPGPELKPGACANPQVGQDLPDSLVGTRMGDRLSSLGGADELRGRAGHDCLFGAAGSDVLVGGSGGDYLAAGTGADRVDARDGQRDSISCGSGWDVVVADRVDVIHGCETVKLPPPDTAELHTR